MKALVLRYVAWLTIIVGVGLALDGATRWIVAGFLLVVCFGNFVADRGAVRDRARERGAERTTSPTSSPGAPEGPTGPSSDEAPEPPPWTLSLLVDADETAKTLRPIVQITGPRMPEEACVHLDVVDACGDVRLTMERWFRRPGLGVDLTLGTLAVPADVSADAVAGWDWRLTLRDGVDELIRQWGPLTGAGPLNDEAELEVLDPRGPAGAATTMDLETLLRLLGSRIAVE